MKKATSGFSCSTSGYSSQSVSCETAAAATDYPQCSRNEYLTPSSYMSTIPTTPMNANSNKIVMRTSTPTAPINNSHKFASGSISTISSFSQPLSPPQFFYSTSSVNIAASEKPTEKRQRGASYSSSSSSSSSSSYIVQFFWFIFSCFNLSWLFKRDTTSRKNSATESIIVSEPISTNLPNKSLPMVVSQICSSTPISSTTLTNNTFYYDQSETYDNIPFNGNTKMIQSSYTSLNRAAIPTYIDHTSNYSHGSEYCSHQSLVNQPTAVFQPQAPITRPIIQTQQQQQHQPIVLSSKSLEKIYENISAASLSLPPNPPPPPTNLQICQHNSTSSSFKCIQNNRNSNIHSTPDDSVLSSSRLSSLSSSPSSSATSSSASLGTNTVNSNNRHSFQVQQQQHVANDFRIQQISPSQDSISLIPAKLPYFAASTMGMQTPEEATTTTTIVKPYYLSMINLSHHDYYTYQNQPIEHHSMNRNQQYYTSTFKSTSQQQQRMYYPSSYQLKQRRNELCKDLFNPVIPHYDDYLCDKEVESYFGDSVYDLCYPSNNISASYNSLQIEQTPQPQLVKQSSHTPYKLKSSPVSFDAGSTLSYDLSTNSSSTNSCAAKVSFSAYQKIFQNSSNLIAISQHSESYC